MEATSMTAKETVIALPELLEMIILQLPAKDIITKATAVSQTWRKTVTSSPKIRHKLFLPTETTQVAEPIDSEKAYHGDMPHYAQHILLNPLMEGAYIIEHQSTRAFRVGEYESYPGNDPKVGFRMINFVGHVAAKVERTTSKRSFMPANASWGNTFVSNPPCSSLHLTRVPNAWRGQFGIAVAMLCESEGITWGSLVDELSQLWDVGGERTGDENVKFFCTLNEPCTDGDTSSHESGTKQSE